MTKDILKMINETLKKIERNELLKKQEIEKEAKLVEKDVWDEILYAYEENPEQEIIKIKFQNFIELPDSTDEEIALYDAVEERAIELLENDGLECPDDTYTHFIIKTSIIKKYNEEYRKSKTKGKKKTKKN